MMTYHLMTEAEKERASDWTYEGEYAIYNEPPYAEQKKQRIGFGNPARDKNFYAYYDGDTFVGYTNILEEEREVFIGIGVRPDLCGQGYGQRIMKLVREISKTLYPGKPLYLEVRTWNRRAIRCYEKAGFVVEGEPFTQRTLIGEGEFIRMRFADEKDRGLE